MNGVGLPLEDIVAVGSFLVTWLIVQAYKRLFPSKPVSPLFVNTLVSAGVGALVYKLAEGNTDAVQIAKAVLAALWSAFGSSGVHHVRSIRKAVKAAADD
jgi:hypothetical protein